jgi:hypothetical protein
MANSRLCVFSCALLTSCAPTVFCQSVQPNPPPQVLQSVNTVPPDNQRRRLFFSYLKTYN